MGLLKIALLQIAPCSTLEGNLEKGFASCRKAKELGVNIARFPEMWSNGYNIYDRPIDQWKAEAIPAAGEFVNAFGVLAKDLDMAIATCNYPDSVPDCNENSSVFDGAAYLPELDSSWDMCIFQADRAEEICLAGLDSEQLRRYRENEVHGNAFRRLQKYRLLLDERTEPPFVRINCRRAII